MRKYFALKAKFLGFILMFKQQKLYILRNLFFHIYGEPFLLIVRFYTLTESMASSLNIWLHNEAELSNNNLKLYCGLD